MPTDSSGCLSSPIQAPSSLLDLTKPLCMELLPQLDSLHLLVFYGEAGLGVSDVQDSLMRLLVKEKRCVVYFTGENAPSAVKASDSLVRFARKTIREVPPKGTVVAISRLPASDEMETRRQVKAISRILEAGFNVVLSLEPEASQVLDAFDVYGHVDCGMVRDYVKKLDESIACSGKCLELSRGIPQLYLALLNSPYVVDGSLGSTYFECLSDLVKKSVGAGLTDEEMQFRLYLYLLGSGSLEDVESELGFKAVEFLQELETQSALFGVSLRERSFLTLPEQAGLPLDYLFDALRRPLHNFQEVIYRAARSLFKRDAHRSVGIASHLKGDLLGRYVLAFGDELLDMGEFGLVRRGLGLLRSSEDVDENMGMALEAALCALTDRHFSASIYQTFTPSFIENFSAGNERARTALLFVDARLRFCGEVREGYEAGAGINSTQGRLRLHANVFRHIVRGELDEAIRLFVGKSLAKQEPTVSSALLALDNELIRLMSCDSLVNGGEWFEKSRTFLERMGQHALLDYLGAVVGLRDLFSDMAGAGEDSYGSKSRLSDDKLIKAFMLIEEAFSYMRHSVWTHASIESNMASGLLAGTEAAPLRDMARLMSAVARDTLGEHTEIDPESYSQSMRLIALLVEKALDTSGEDLPYSPRSRNLPRENTWFILLLSNGIEPFSVRFEDELFPEWRRALAAARKTVCPNFGMCEMAPIVLLDAVYNEAPKNAQQPSGGLFDERLRINLLGEFSVCVGSRIIDCSRLQQRQSKAMLEFLVLHKRYSVSQTKLFDQLWPDVPYPVANERMYQTKSNIRKVLRSFGFTPDPFVSGRANGMIGLDPSLVRCDVDDLLAKARATVNEKDDSGTIELALETECLYAGDLWMPMSDATGFVTSMASRTKTTYTDAMVSGARAALKIGRLQVATRLANSALLADGMREDAEMILMRSLKQSGRAREARESYESFCQNMAELAGRPVSKQLRSQAAELLIPCEKSA